MSSQLSTLPATTFAGEYTGPNALGLMTRTAPKLPNSTNLAAPFAPVSTYDEYASTETDSSSDECDGSDDSQDDMYYYGIRLNQDAATPNLRQFVPADISGHIDRIVDQYVAPTAAQRAFAGRQISWAYMVNASKYIKAFTGVRRKRLQEQRISPGFPRGFRYKFRAVDENRPEGDIVVNDDGRYHGVLRPKGGEWAAHGGSPLREINLFEA